MKTRSQTQTKGSVQINNQASSSISLSSLPQPSLFCKNPIQKKMGIDGINQSFQILQGNKYQSRQLETSTEKINNQFISMLAKRKDRLKILNDQIQQPKNNWPIKHLKQPLYTQKINVVPNNPNQQLSLVQKQRLDAEQRQNIQILKVHLSQPLLPSPFPELSFQQKQKQKFQQCFQQQSSSFEFISQQTFNKTFSSLTEQKQQAYLKLKIIEPYLRATIQVLSGKFRTSTSSELEYLWDLDHYRVWLTRQQAKQQVFLLYMQKCKKDTQSFMLNNRVKINCKRTSPLLFKGILLQKIRIFEARRKEVIEDIKAWKSQAFSERISTPPKNLSKKNMMKHQIQGQPMNVLEETLKLTEKYLNKSKLGGTVVNIIAPNLNIFEKSAERKFKNSRLDGLSITQIYEYKREIQSWIQKHPEAKEENSEVQLINEQIE